MRAQLPSHPGVSGLAAVRRVIGHLGRVHRNAALRGDLPVVGVVLIVLVVGRQHLLLLLHEVRVLGVVPAVLLLVPVDLGVDRLPGKNLTLEI